MTTMMPLNKLKFGDDYPGGSINARKAGRDDGLIELAATILDKGLIHALIIKVAPNGKPYVAEGNRRLKALRHLVGHGKIPKDWPVKVEELAAEIDPLEASLTANIMQLPMHEVDQYEAFAQLRTDGKSVVDIASSFGTSELVVNRRLALGGLSPKLRQAWREDKIKTEAATAFTIVTDHALQDEVYTSLAKGQMLHRHSIVRALTRSDLAGNADLRFVGKEAYLAAGGRLAEDLFVEESHVLDGEILKRLEREKMASACTALVAEGWRWAACVDDLPGERYRWPKCDVAIAYTEDEMFRLEELKPLVDTAGGASQVEWKVREAARTEAAALSKTAWLRSITADDKARSGCVLRVGYDGKLSIEHGIVRPGDVGEATAGDLVGASDGGTLEDAAPTEAGHTISGALSQAVSEQLTTAVADALMQEPDVALRVIVAALQSYRSPARISSAGWSGLDKTMLHPPGHKQDDFTKRFALTERSSRTHLLVEMAGWVASSLDLTEAARTDSARSVCGRQELIDALDAEAYLKAARMAFDAAAYFDRAPATVAIAAVEEMGGPKPTGKKGVIALAAAALAEELGWLPEMMRSIHYVPPRVADVGTKPRRRGKEAAMSAAAS